MKNCMTAVLAFVALMGAGVPIGHAAEKTAVEPPALELLDKSAMEKMKPGAAREQNQILAALVGGWDFDLKYWSRNGAEAQLSTGTVTNEMVLGGGFLSSKMMVMLNIGGENIPYEGWSLEGYDTAKKAYTSVLADKIHTGITAGAGQYNEKTKTLEEKGTFAHPLAGKERKYRSELEFTSSDEYKRTVYITDNAGKEFKMLEIDFRKPR